MQKKKNLPDTSPSSNWQDTVKNQQRKDNVKKYGIWVGIIALCIAGLAGLVMLAGKTAAPATPVEKPNLPKVTSKDIIVGNKDAKVTIIEYGDLQCPACASYNPIVNELLAKNDGKVRLVFRFFPLTNVHQNAIISAQAAYAAHKQGKFDEMKDILFSKQGDWETEKDPRDIFIGYAASIKGMDADKFKADMNSDEAKAVVLAGEKESLGLGLNSTPSFFIGNKYIVPQGYDDLQTLVNQELKNAQ